MVVVVLLLLLLLLLLLRLVLVACEGETEALHAHSPGFGGQLEALQPLVMDVVVFLVYSWLR